MTLNRRNFLKTSLAATVGLGVAGMTQPTFSMETNDPLFKVSLAEWSLNRLLFGGELDHLDFPLVAREHGIEAVEYVNQFFMDKAEDKAYLREMKLRADNEGVRSLLIMCDSEGAIGHPDEAERIQAVENHKKWVEAAKYLGCHSIRVNGFTSNEWGTPPGDYDEEMKQVADGLRRLCEFADAYAINVIIENHGGHSSNAQWLVGVMERANHPRAGTLPDFGNFSITDSETYPSYKGVQELMPYAKGVSVKPMGYDEEGNRIEIDMKRMMSIVLDAGYRGYCGIEHGPEGREWEGIEEVHRKLKVARDQLAQAY